MSCNSRRNTFFRPSFPLRRFLLNRARSARSSPILGGSRSCDVEKGSAAGVGQDKIEKRAAGEGPSNNLKVSFHLYINVFVYLFQICTWPLT